MDTLQADDNRRKAWRSGIDEANKVLAETVWAHGSFYEDLALYYLMLRAKPDKSDVYRVHIIVIFCNKGFACSNKPDLVPRSVKADTASEAPEEKFNQVLRPESHLVATPKRLSCCRAGALAPEQLLACSVSGRAWNCSQINVYALQAQSVLRQTCPDSYRDRTVALPDTFYTSEKPNTNRTRSSLERDSLADPQMNLDCSKEATTAEELW